MEPSMIKKLAGWLLILGAVLVNIPYGLLIANFDYPQVLRLPAEQILAAFRTGGAGLIYTWLAFAWSGFPLLIAFLLLPRVLTSLPKLTLSVATTFGVVGAVAQMVGLLRWVFVVPVLVQSYFAPGSSPTSQASIVVTFQMLHQLGGVLLGEHIGQMFTIIWMGLLSLGLLRQSILPRWLGWFGIFASLVYFLAQGELLATVIPTFPQFDLAGMLGSLLWLSWMAVLGISLIRSRALFNANLPGSAV